MGYVGIEEDYYVSVKSVLDITAETGALTTQSRIRELTPANVAQVVHSEWIYHMSYGVCKKCGYEYEWKGTDAKNYCPNCGAKMDAQEEE